MKPLVRKKEEEWITLIVKKFPRRGALVGIGDDAAVIDPGKKTCVTTDLLIEGVDFRLEWAPPQAVGWKALAVNLSDLYAMGAVPSYFLLSIGIPRKIKDGWIEGMLDGMAALARREKICLIGGDLSGSPDRLVISITAHGSPAGQPVLRGGALPGDAIFVTAPLGGPSAALELFKKGSRLDEFPLAGRIAPGNALLDRFYRPPGQAALADVLSRERVASSAIDITDGLLLDLSRLLRDKGRGAVLRTEDIPRFSPQGGKEASLDRALYGGEEQTLLFTAGQRGQRKLARLGTPVHRIGSVTASKGILLEERGKRRKAEAEGFDHFS